MSNATNTGKHRALDERKEREKDAVREQLSGDPIQRQLDREEAERNASTRSRDPGVDAPEVVTRAADGSATVQAHSPETDPNLDPRLGEEIDPDSGGRHLDVAKMGAGKQVDASGSTEPAHPGVRGDIAGRDKAGGIKVLSDEEKRERHEHPNGPGQPDGRPERD